MRQAIDRLLARAAGSGVFFVLPLMAIDPALAAEKTAIAIAPGLRGITPEEAALTAGPLPASVQGVVLLDETDRDDSSGRESLTAHHFRAKIFSASARELTTLEIPIQRPRGVLKKWWAWIIRPDGGFRELGGTALQEEMLLRPDAHKVGFLRATLDDAGPGCVVDYGYFIEEEWPESSARIEIQRTVPVKRFFYRWTPGGPDNGTYTLGGTTGLQITAVRDSRSVLVSGMDLPALVEEPWMPPRREVGARVILYYRPTAEKADIFWSNVAKDAVHRADYFAQAEAIHRALDLMQIPPSGNDLNSRLLYAYDWLTLNVRNNSLQTSENVWSHTGKKERAAPRSMGLLEKREATSGELAFFYRGIARALGADAALVLAARTEDHSFDPSLLTTDQINQFLVAVRAPGEPDSAFRMIAPGSGLPLGQIPWWLTGGQALMADLKGPSFIRLWPSEPRQNVSETIAHLAFLDQAGTLKASWSRTGTGQQGYQERLKLRGLLTGERRQLLEEYCGSKERLVVTAAEAPDVSDLTKGFRLVCEGTVKRGDFDPTQSEVTLRIDGIWLVPVPELESAQRINPLVFSFPRIDNTFMEIEAPKGFAPADRPSPVLLETAYGSYTLFVRPTEYGYEIRRSFSLTVAGGTVEEYPAIRRFLNQVRDADRTPLRFRSVPKS